MKSGQAQNTLGAMVGISELVDSVTETVRQAEQQTIVRHLGELHRFACFVAQTATDKDERDVVERVAVPLTQFVGPDDGGVIEHRSRGARFRRFRKAFGQVGDLLGIPLVDFGQLFLGGFVAVGFVGKLVVPFVDPQPFHAGHAH